MAPHQGNKQKKHGFNLKYRYPTMNFAVCDYEAQLV